ncbi:SpoIID/LytB domain-containing protein [Nitriliruptoraceae bacterium ZYF776]|nr:SpoIID/LytB domain-containing protein [Profundirhabdus halotolerans]
MSGNDPKALIVRSRRPLTRLATLGAALALAVPLTVTSASASDGVPVRSSVANQADPNPNVVLRGSGWGHSVGMSQYGAYAAARQGRSHSQILSHYYPGTALNTESDDQRVTVRLFTGNAQGTNATARGGAVTWRICPAGGTCRNEQQPAGSTWRVEATGDQRIALTREGGTVYAGNGNVELRLTSPDSARSAGSAPGTYVETANPAGTRAYGYGWLMYRAEAGGLHLSNRLALGDYLRGLGEVPSSWGGGNGGQEALVAQAIIARTYMLAQGGDTCATAACQVFVGLSKELEPAGTNWVAAVQNPAGRVMRYGNGFAQTYYSSSHGGRTEASEDSWAYGSPVPYLISVDDPWSLDAVNPMRSWTTTVSNAAFRRVAGAGLSRVTRVEVRGRTAGGTPTELRVFGPEGHNDFSTTPASARTSRACNRRHAGNSLRCDLTGATVRDASGATFSGAGGQPPSSQIRTVGFEPFVDDDGNTHEYAIVWANAAGVALGTSDTTFAPRRPVTRGQMASFLYRTFDVPQRSSHAFSDVPDGPHSEAIASVAAARIAQGYPDGSFRPSAPVTREQMASFLVRALGLSPRSAAFSDVRSSNVHAGSIGAIAHSGITEGCSRDRFCPTNSVTRDQMAAFLYRAVRTAR